MQDCKTLFTSSPSSKAPDAPNQGLSVFEPWLPDQWAIPKDPEGCWLLHSSSFESLLCRLYFCLLPEKSLECLSWSTRSNLTLELFNPNHSLTPSPRTQLDHLKCLCKVCKVRKGGIGGGVGASKTETRREEGKDSRSDLCSAILCSHLRPRKTFWLPA